jgi:peptide/nickel transport system ATP-binding protein
MKPANVLEIGDFTVHYLTRQGPVRAVDGISLAIGRGEAIGLVGESGCGKSTLVLGVLRILPENANIVAGRVLVGETDLVSLPEEEMRTYRWKRISMVFQGAMSSFNPVHRVGDQIVEAITNHERVGTAAAKERVSTLFRSVGLDPSLAARYPHELSGGMKQRAVIAMALSCGAELVIADEPTTALDVIVQDRILKELQRIQRETGTSMLYISHDIAVIAEVCRRVGVMYAGKLVEMAKTEDLFERPLHPYTAALISAIPSIAGEKRTLSSLPGEPPDLLKPPSGCRFHPRSGYATDVCQQTEPPIQEHLPTRQAACWHPLIRERVVERST